MKLIDFFEIDACIPELKATDRNGVIRELIDSLSSVHAIEEADKEAIARACIARENHGSTGFGKGVAVPHVKHAAATRMSAAIGRSTVGVDFAALDRAPVYTVVLLLSPAARQFPPLPQASGNERDDAGVDHRSGRDAGQLGGRR